MKPKVLLAGGSGYIGKYLSEVIENETDVFILSKYPHNKQQHNKDMTWLKCDIYNYEQVVTSMKDIDIAVFYIDPTKNSAKITQSSAKDLTLIAADNFGRAAVLNNVSKIIYIPGSQYDNETIERLGAYGAIVETTKVVIKRALVNVELQVSKYDDVRSSIKVPLPKGWTIEHVVTHFVKWMDQTKGTFLKTSHNEDEVIVYIKNKFKPLAIFHKIVNADGIITLYLIGGRLIKKRSKAQGKLEFRQFKGTSIIMIHLYDYIPRLFWPIYYVIQAPLQKMMIHGFEVDCRIKDFQSRIKSGEKIKYTK
ncbi:3-beta hydroxysteroid dehydrogenase [Staphylococcus simiae]|uniref:NAD-dependent epimerase/dehydratase family protein n=1 Tax=Staphylococcus simiae TaxID=308354 RepID=UPI001A960807|nr:NAD-dependent epimerase/dehydratase family protein [Staphylococcus simiae]MBO1198834.1 3-beta hydroxysteroid dehydrogenase [Staphylococcus simiae]MBO1201031.1 3-beta hydroxysteroid dehydrogenase [Staphylococcus simiae]MBO1203847.1 3-beta hydroxysteroid dehydrogenase [Staphylococcus simiae]MBO1211071.1 3-beta hydroxysteroid dehydrogenase [Staphylococcus simiae]MBO1229376.1 3-beta hydroxysteroid dehydrogenase [Staphylococcus simiae]